MILPQTQWIGGSYEAACGIVPTTAQKLLVLIRRHPGRTTADLADRTGRRVDVTYQALRRMLKRKEVVRVKSTTFLRRGGSLIDHWYAADHRFH